jgi:hypothetical protein
VGANLFKTSPEVEDAHLEILLYKSLKAEKKIKPCEDGENTNKIKTTGKNNTKEQKAGKELRTRKHLMQKKKKVLMCLIKPQVFM